MAVKKKSTYDPNMISTRKVAYSGPDGADLLIVGEAPGEDEDYYLKPFVGRSGEVLDSLLAVAGIDRESCKIANVCNYRPAGNNWDYLKDSPQLREGENQLRDYINRFPPKVILALGDKALRFFGGRYGISEMRGAPFPTKLGFVLPTFHPAYLFHQGGDYPIVAHDFKKAARYLTNPWVEPKRNFIINPTGLELHGIVDMLSKQPMLNCDFEWVSNTTQLRSAQFAWSATDAVFLGNHTLLSGGTLNPEFSWAVQEILRSSAKKCFQGGNADMQVLMSNGFVVENWTDDTMVLQHVMEPELPQGLYHLATLYTEEPYWKSDSLDDFKNYSCKDVITGYQILEGQLKDATKKELRMYRYKMEQAHMAADISFNGLPFDKDRNRLLKDLVLKQVTDQNLILQFLVGHPLNVSSNPQMKKQLYDVWGFTPRKKRTGEITCDEKAIMALIAQCKKDIETYKTPAKKEEKAKVLLALRTILKIRELRKLFEVYLDFEVSGDGRVRSYYKITGTETNRWSAAKYIDNTGTNAQTFPRGGVESNEQLAIQQS